MKKRVGITGVNGFIGKHLCNVLKLYPDEFEVIDFHRDFFYSSEKLDEFISSSDVIIHLAAINRHEDLQILHDTNVELVKKIVNSLNNSKNSKHVIFSSSTQEDNNNLYGESKKIARQLLSQWAVKEGAIFTGLIIPNVFGPFGVPNYNSVIATFCSKVVQNEEPLINEDRLLKLIYVDELAEIIIYCIRNSVNNSEYKVPHSAEKSVSNILETINYFKSEYDSKGIIPSFEDRFELQLFNTFRSFIDMKVKFPQKLVSHNDQRGAFVELIRAGSGGQTSFSTTSPGITRGNHFHRRKIERFIVIKGRAKIEIRKIGTDDILSFILDGESTAYVDMPVWYTHNITNIGDDTLYTIFWINEPFIQDDPDTYHETV